MSSYVYFEYSYVRGGGRGKEDLPSIYILSSSI